MRRPLIIAHRGASGYEYENSLAAFRRAVMLDADAVELDLHTSADGALVVHHDDALPGLGPIRDLSLASVRRVRLANGEPVPLLGEVLDLIGDRGVWVEIKSLPAEADATLLDTLRSGPAPHRYGVHSFDHRVVARLGCRQPDLRRGILLSSYPVDPIAVLRAAGASTLWEEWRHIDAALVDSVHQAGGEIIAWTVDDLSDLAHLARLGVDGLCSNYPDRIRVALAALSSTASSI